MPEQAAHLALAQKRIPLLGAVAVSPPQHLHGEDGAGLAVDRAVNTSERPGTCPVLDSRGTEIQTATTAGEQLLDLVAGEQLAAHEDAAEAGSIGVVPARFAKRLLQIRPRCELEFDRGVQ